MNQPSESDQAVRQALERLQGLLPLVKRLSRQALAARRVHRAILGEFARCGRTPERDTLAQLTQPECLDDVLASLGDADLIVRTPRGGVTGAYPFTLERTPHLLTLPGATVNAMCAVDALAVAPVFDCEVAIASSCTVTGVPIAVRQRGDRVLAVSPAQQLHVGIGWRQPHACAANTLCREMVFLRDHAVATAWQETDQECRTVYSLGEAIALGAAFFSPLLEVPI